jgi:hypothetical protein
VRAISLIFRSGIRLAPSRDGKPDDRPGEGFDMARTGMIVLGLAMMIVLLSAPVAFASALILEAHFDAGTDGFKYYDDTFRGTHQPSYAKGMWVNGPAPQNGTLQITVGGVDNLGVKGMSGGFAAKFVLSVANRITLNFRARLSQTCAYESDEKSQVLVSIDKQLVGTPPNDWVVELAGDGAPNDPVDDDTLYCRLKTTGWKLFTVDLGLLDAGGHQVIIGAWNNKKTRINEVTTLLLDDVVLTGTNAGAESAVAALDFDRFKLNMEILGNFGDRHQGTQSNIDAGNWIEAQLGAAGYVVERHTFLYSGQPRDNIYATKIGTVYPDQMYIVSCHFDGIGGGGAVNDNASGCSLVLEAARALAGMQTAVSVRFVFWNNEETGLNGSTAYVTQRVGLQGIEDPPGSGLYPEPTWLGIIQHDQILFDHGLPPQPSQIAAADIDIEYQAGSVAPYNSLAQQLANRLLAGNTTYSTTYPAQVGNNMNFTDSMPFRNHTAAVSVRDNQRVAEIGMGSNPHWHAASDVYATYSEDDFRLGFNAVQMTLGTVAELAGTH